MIRFAAIGLAGALLTTIALPASAAQDRIDEDMAGADADANVAHAARLHGREAGEHGNRRHGMMGQNDIMTTFDTNGDGQVTQAEIDDFRGSRLAKFDTDGDGNLTLAEYQALWLAAMREKMVDQFQALDADGDAMVTAEEFKRPYADLVRRIDRNGDGVLTRPHQRAAVQYDPDDDEDEEQEQN